MRVAVKKDYGAMIILATPFSHYKLYLTKKLPIVLYLISQTNHQASVPESIPTLTASCIYAQHNTTFAPPSPHSHQARMIPSGHAMKDSIIDSIMRKRRGNNTEPNPMLPCSISLRCAALED